MSVFQIPLKFSLMESLFFRYFENDCNISIKHCKHRDRLTAYYRHGVSWFRASPRHNRCLSRSLHGIKPQLIRCYRRSNDVTTSSISRSTVSVRHPVILRTQISAVITVSITPRSAVMHNIIHSKTMPSTAFYSCCYYTTGIRSALHSIDFLTHRSTLE